MRADVWRLFVKMFWRSMLRFFWILKTYTIYIIYIHKEMVLTACAAKSLLFTEPLHSCLSSKCSLTAQARRNCWASGCFPRLCLVVVHFRTRWSLFVERFYFDEKIVAGAALWTWWRCSAHADFVADAVTRDLWTCGRRSVL